MSNRKQAPKQISSKSVPQIKNRAEIKTKPSTKKSKNEHEEKEDKKKKTISETALTKNRSIPEDKSKKQRVVRNNVNSKPGVVKKTSSFSRPATPPSKRVSKSQFFPTKKMYSNALTTTPKTEKPEDMSSDSSCVSERPRTATLKKGKIVSKTNPAAGPEASSSASSVQPEPDYEDDFETYESDFEEYSSSTSTTPSSISTGSASTSEEIKSAVRLQSSDEEKKLDSGNYELPESKHRQILHNITETSCTEEKSSDEGFEDGKSLQFINFAGANQKAERRRSMEKKKKRGEDILGMIKLDLCNFTLYDFPQMLYEDFIKIFGRHDTLQTCTQTNEDARAEETQTEDISLDSKWAQFPPRVLHKFDENDEDFWTKYRQNLQGIGGETTESKKALETDIGRLEMFLESAAHVILNLQKEAISSKIEDFSSKQTNMPFSKGVLVYDTAKLNHDKYLKDVIFTEDNTLITVHCNRKDSSFDESCICLWQIGRVDQPVDIFHCYGHISSISSHGNFYFAGLGDGTISVWDLRQTLTKRPAFCSDINAGHCDQVIAIEIGPDSSNFPELCSLDEEGIVIIWNLIAKENSLELVVTTKMALKQLYPEIGDFKCHAVILNKLNELFIATNHGIILHCLANGAKTPIKSYRDNVQFPVFTLEKCPFSELYFMAGLQNGDVEFFTHSVQKPLIVMSNKSEAMNGKPIEQLQWSEKPLIFYTRTKNVINVWNLKESDLFPVFSVPFKDDLVTMKVSRNNKDDSNTNYMVVADKKGFVYFYTLDYGGCAGDVDKEKQYFFNYTNRYV